MKVTFSFTSGIDMYMDVNFDADYLLMRNLYG